MRFSITPVLLFAFLFSACGDADRRADRVDDTGVRAPTAAANERGQGSITLGDEQYVFTVRICDFSGDVDDDMVQTLVGRGETSDGEPFDVFVSRNDVNGMLSHSISFQQGDVVRGEGTVIEAQRIRMGDDWNSPYDAMRSPLIEISGDRLQATGVFVHADDDSEQMEGRIEATCRS